MLKLQCSVYGSTTRLVKNRICGKYGLKFFLEVCMIPGLFEVPQSAQMNNEFNAI